MSPADSPIFSMFPRLETFDVPHRLFSFIDAVSSHFPFDAENRRLRSDDLAVRDCYKFCPVDHWKGPYGTLIDPYAG